MCEFLLSADLWANIVGGVVAAGLIGLGVCVKNWRKHRILMQLTEIMGDAIVHRNKGERKEYTDENVWIQQATDIENKAIAKAKEFSSTAGSLVQWLDRTDEPWTTKRERSVKILSKVIVRIRELLERNS